VLVHQILALTLQFGAVSRERCWELLAVVPDFAGISRAEFDALVEHLITAGFLFVSGGLLSMGDEAERVFGRQNFMELYAVFTTPQLYRVTTATGYVVGSLEQAFVDTLVEAMSSFLLGGHAWTVDHVNHHERTVHVTLAPRGTKPSWGGFAPQLLGFDVCQQIAALLRSDTTIPYIDAASQDALAAYRQDIGSLLRRPGLCLQVGPEEALWWTFAGGRINHTLKYGLQLQQDWRAVPDNFRLRIVGGGLSCATLENSIDCLSTDGFWHDPTNQRRLLAKLPAYRLSKFQRALPERYALEMIRDYMLDIPGALRWLRSERGRGIQA
jgi:ATP-dependent Lhr-like helicase